MTNFQGIQFFRPNGSDNWGDPSKISRELLLELDKFRAFLGVPIYVTSGYRPNDPGQHGKGLAVDIVVPAYKGRLLDLYLAAERFGFTGIGLYPDFLYQTQKVGGLHLDMREGKPARWIGLGRGDGNRYIGLNQANLKIHGVI